MNYTLKNTSADDIVLYYDEDKTETIIKNVVYYLVSLDSISTTKGVSVIKSEILQGNFELYERGEVLFLDQAVPVISDLEVCLHSNIISRNIKLSSDFNLYYGTDLIDKIGNLSLKEKAIASYRIHKKNGVLFYENFRADLVVALLQGNKTPAQVFEIEEKVNHLKPLLLEGDWRTSQNKANSLIAEGALEQSLVDAIKNYINNYVTANF